MKNFAYYVFIISSICTGLLLTGSCKKEKGMTAEIPLEITQFYPNSGKAGTLVTIEGEGFSTEFTGNRVYFSGQEAEVLSVHARKIVVRAPSAGSSGIISLTREEKTVEVGTYTYQSLSLQQLLPAKAQGGSQIQIKGEGFGSLEAPPTVKFNDLDAAILSVTDTMMFVEVPAEGAGATMVSVTVDGMTAEGPVFQYMNIDKLKPLTGGAGTKVRISGEGFDEAQAGNVVTFNGVEAVVTEATATELTVLAPEDVKTGPVAITIDGEAINGPDFTVVPFPSILTVSPLSGPSGLEMVISGETFSAEEGETHVFINDVEVPLSSVSSSEITLILPGGTGSGKVVVEVNDQATEGPVFRDQNLGITRVSPDNGLSGTEVTIEGAGFSDMLTENQVTFNGVSAEVISAEDNVLVVRAPENLTTGVLKVSVTDQYAEAPEAFRRAGVLSLGQGSLNLSTAGGSIAVDPQDNLYITEIEKNQILKITPDGIVSVFAGSTTGAAGNADGHGSEARFSLSENAGLAMDAERQCLYLSDPGNQSLRRISFDGEVSTLISNFGGGIGKIAFSPEALYVSNSSATTRMWKVALPGGSYSSVLVAHTHPDVRHAVDPMGNIYSMQIGVFTSRIGIATLTGSSWTKNFSWVGGAIGFVDAVGSAARFGVLTGFTLADPDHLMVLDPENLALRSANIHTAEVTTPFQAAQGFADGNLSEAKMSTTLTDLAVGSDGSIYILDAGNNVVRKVMLR